MVKPSTPPANGFVAAMRHLYNPIGFSKGYNFVLFFIFGGALLGFTLARFQYIDFNVICPRDGSDGPNSASASECFKYRTIDRYRIGIQLHLATVIPAGFLAVFQFVPVIRHKVLLYHRMAGWVIVALVLVSHASAIMIADEAFGGGAETQMVLGWVAIVTTIGIGMAVYNIKRLQIDQHRAWMLRTWFWISSIITTRLFMIIGAMVLANISKSYYIAMTCAKLGFILGNDEEHLFAKYPLCQGPDGAMNATAVAPIKVDFNDALVGLNAALMFFFGGSFWISWALHAVGVEIYLYLTPKEADRLRQVSYQRQMERGMKNPGRAGLVPEKFGDMEPWVPQNKRGMGEAKVAHGSETELGMISPGAMK